MTDTTQPKPRVLSGMRPTGKLHLGHLGGALDNWVKLQDKYDCFFFVADWHALTSDYADTSRVKTNIIEMAFDWLAAGLDPERSVIFTQSHVPQHAELFLLLSMITPLGWLERVPTYKEQRENIKDKDLGNYGFLGYPVLQTADIIIYRAAYVPVGEDQVAHIEISREITRRFNTFYGDVFPEPQALLTPTPKLPGTDGRKMSKSYGNAILLSDPEPEIRQKLKTMVTDPARVRRTDPGNPEKCPVWGLHQVYSTQETRDWVWQGCTTAGIGCLECKQPVIDAIIREQQPIRERAQRYLDDPSLVRNIVADGCERARKLAEETMRDVREAMGLRYD